MFLPDHELRAAIECGDLVVNPKPAKFDSNSIDLHVDSADQARIWDIEAFRKDMGMVGHNSRELRIGRFVYKMFADKYQVVPPTNESAPVFRRGNQIIVKPGGFLLWQTRERIGTPEENAKYVCFINSKSTQARTGLVVHMTAPTINASWNGNVTLEIANFGPFEFVLQDGDVMAQITVARLTSVPESNARTTGSATFGQSGVGGGK